MALVDFSIPYEKYRIARAISEVARQVDATNVFLTFDGYELDEKGNRIGNLLLGFVWNSDGAARGCGMSFTQEGGNLVMQDKLEMTEWLTGGALSIRWKEEAAHPIPNQIKEATQGGDLAA